MKQNRGTQPRDKSIRLRLSTMLFTKLHEVSINKNQTISELIRNAVTEQYSTDLTDLKNNKAQ